MTKKILDTDRAPKAIGPYSQGIAVGELLFLSGQIPLDPATGELVAGDVGAQTERVLDNLEAVLAAGGLEFRHVVKTTIFLTDLADFGRVNELYGRRFPTEPPARATVQVAALPRGARVEIEAIAHRNA
ncbi:MAG: RidA family protein [Deltaproteobacteria bacterium]|nr:RidA family protein [Deltaproteobacteria bacterium]